jgi:type II secretory pathway pseudopilin PulG
MGFANVAGFTYVGLLIAIVILGVGLSAVGVVWRTQGQREREQELLFIGRDFKRALASYYMDTGNGGHQYPQEIADLLEDKRGTEIHHHLRRFYADPMTGAQDWNLIRVDMLGITGIASSSQSAPIKKSGFPKDESEFEDATCYCDWKFLYKPRIAGRRANPVPRAAD